MRVNTEHGALALRWRVRRAWPFSLLLLVAGCSRPDDDAKLDVAVGAVPAGWVQVGLPELGMAFCLPKSVRTVPMPFHGTGNVKASTTHAYIDEGPPIVELQVRTIDTLGKARPDRQMLDVMIKGLPSTQKVQLNGPVREEKSAIGTRFVQEAVRDGKTISFVFWIRPTRFYTAVCQGPADLVKTFLDSMRLRNPDPSGKNQEPASIEGGEGIPNGFTSPPPQLANPETTTPPPTQTEPPAQNPDPWPGNEPPPYEPPIENPPPTENPTTPPNESGAPQEGSPPPGESPPPAGG